MGIKKIKKSLISNLSFNLSFNFSFIIELIKFKTKSMEMVKKGRKTRFFFKKLVVIPLSEINKNIAEYVRKQIVTLIIILSKY